ncbi:MAG TPA: glycosyltransferase family 2 protein [Actinobacteria bacterium]|jgi:glycosyltransferase involved in cell wall biosynthesis|nr:glycosyltransferase family 2 protein [Actinomycetota bacterium]
MGTDNRKKYSISAFFPVYNDWGTIPTMVLLAESVLEKYASEYEIILVDDGSNKLTKQVLESLDPKIKNLKIITHRQNKGYGGAIKSGIYNAEYELIFYTDGDAQYNPLELESLIQAMSSETDIVNGYKIERNDPLYRKIIGRLYYYVTKMLFSFKIKDVDCDFRLMRRSLFENLELRYNSGVVCVEMISKLTMRGARFAEVPVNHYYRLSGKSQFFNFKRIFNTGIHLLKLWYRIKIRKEY